MDATIRSLTERQVWKSLAAHYQNVRELHLRKLFTDDPKRGEHMTAEAVGLYLDYSKNRITDETLKLLLQLADESGLRERIDAMFRGEKINVTENRAVLHVALRAPRGASIVVDGENVVPQVHAVLDKMTDFSIRVRSGAWKGHTSKPIRNVINIGIGGSDLGPVMAYEALKHYSERTMTFRFVSNVDGTDAHVQGSERIFREGRFDDNSGVCAGRVRPCPSTKRTHVCLRAGRLRRDAGEGRKRSYADTRTDLL
jgi:glucose-6-phosphate isomerase